MRTGLMRRSRALATLAATLVAGVAMVATLVLALLAVKALLVLAWLGLVMIGGALMLVDPVKAAMLALVAALIGREIRPPKR